MKRAILLLAVAFSSAANVFPQAGSGENNGYLNAFEADSAVWSYLHGWGYGPPSIHQMILYGDTTIDNIKWKIVTDLLIGKGLVRTDGKKVIVRGCTGQTSFGVYDLNEKYFVYETVYDFSLNVGDSVLTMYHYNEPGYSYIPSRKSEISEIDSIVLNDGKKHKRIKFTIGGENENYMIEGIGCVSSNVSHPFFMFISQPTGDRNTGGPTFVCCEVDGELLYLNPEYADCDGNKVANEIIGDNTFKPIISLSDGNLRVTVNDGSLFDVSVYNMQGIRVLYVKDNRNEMIAGSENLPHGVYIVRVHAGDSVFSGKIAK
ncbi:MAG: T9SS type A sorting domain-containing protein [Tannerella sp.]|nr:T9SS type A sorting domain-containing protein [Tannerella sp.]